MRNRDGQDRKSKDAHVGGPPGYRFALQRSIQYELSRTRQEHLWIEFGIQEFAA